MSNGWIVARTQPKRENWAAQNVAQQGYEYYLPKIMVVQRRYARAEPLFQCYLFVRTPGAWHFLLGTFGISSVVILGSSPTLLPDAEVQKLRSKERNGLVQLEHLQEEGRPRFKRGDLVRVTGGVFSGYTGVYHGMDARDRNRVLFDFLGRRVPTLLAGNILEAAAA